ncbi:hypothetical protein PILCRDRAFT_243073 [Piloderma croceum F 1598]|uniref:Uncharacterized protein n=1 Tax=Piloderma croceum (strain F 1598) TaxID=765440 RepID=A0A0C3FX89_PILCF|nr:hypothetical protein PILCRDRAFT_243073 [Piloderma croceum F 1598]
MPLFGLFNSKKDKKSANGISTSTNGRSNASAASAQDDESMWESISPTTQSHIHGDDTPSEPAPTSSRMKMPFQRRKASVSAVTSLPQTSPSRPQRAPNPYMSSSSADVTGQLRPPIKSAIFSSYGETSGSSTRSLPSTTRTAPDTFSYQDMIDDTSRMPSQPKKKSGGLLTWARERTKSKPSSPPVIPAEAFNLRTFRHVRPGSPLQSERPSVDLSLEPPPARPRPRGDSAVSDSSQRISVAAFREAQARRSTANSPVPSFRPPSSTDTLTTRALTPTRSVPQIDKTRTHAAARRSIVPDSSSSSASSEEEESDDDAPPNSHLGRRKRTITKRPYARAQTDIGHGQQHSESQNEPARRSMVAIQPSPTAQMVGSSRAPSSMGAYGKSRGSVSTSALDSNRRSSVDFPARKVPSKQMHSSDSSSSDSDSDDAPLASLVGPRRPGSAMSGASNPRSRAPSKPLIDIKTLVTDQTVLSSSPVSATRDQEMEREDVTGLAKLAALARQAAEAEDRSQSPSPPPKVAQPQPKVALSRPVASNFSIPKHRRSSSDIVTSLSTPAAEPPYPLSRGQEAPASTYSPQPIVTTRVISPEPNEVDDDDIMPALRFMMPKTYPADGDSSAPADSSATNEARIVPTPIRQRIPLSSFSVMSRPQHRTQQSSNSILTAPSTSTSTSTSPTITPKIVSSTASTSMASLASKTTSPRPGRGRSSALTISTDPLLTSSSSTSSPSSSPTLPPSVLKRPAPTSTKPPQPASPVKSTTSTSQSESSSGLTRRSRGSTTLISQIPPSASLNPDSRPQALSSSKNLSRPDTLVSRIPTPSSIVSTAKPKPFAGSAMRRESPASSTGDSSSGRLPLTPRDGSDFGSKDNWDRMGRLSGGLQQGRDNKEHRKKRSVSFGEDFDFERGRDKGIARERERERERERAEDVETPVEGENRRRDRRRSEARAAIEVRLSSCFTSPVCI